MERKSSPTVLAFWADAAGAKLVLYGAGRHWSAHENSETCMLVLMNRTHMLHVKYV